MSRQDFEYFAFEGKAYDLVCNKPSLVTMCVVAMFAVGCSSLGQRQAPLGYLHQEIINTKIGDMHNGLLQIFRTDDGRVVFASLTAGRIGESFQAAVTKNIGDDNLYFYGRPLTHGEVEVPCLLVSGGHLNEEVVSVPLPREIQTSGDFIEFARVQWDMLMFDARTSNDENSEQQTPSH